MATSTSLKTAHGKFIEYLKTKKRALATVVAYKKDIEQLINHLDRAGKSMAHEVKTADLKAFLDNLATNNYTPKSISRKINSTRTFFKFLKVEGSIQEDPAQALTHPKLDPKAPRIFTKQEYRALRDACRNDVRTLAVVELLLQTGIRIGELANLEVSDFKPASVKKSGELRIAPFESREERTVPVNSAASKAVEAYLEIRPEAKEKHLFITKTGRPLLIRNIRATIDRYFKTAGIESAKVNDLRHTFVAYHLSKGVSITIISKIAGHKRVSTTEKYLEYIQRPAEERQELEEL